MTQPTATATADLTANYAGCENWNITNADGALVGTLRQGSISGAWIAHNADGVRLTINGNSEYGGNKRAGEILGMIDWDM